MNARFPFDQAAVEAEACALRVLTRILAEHVGNRLTEIPVDDPADAELVDATYWLTRHLEDHVRALERALFGPRAGLRG